MQRTTHAGPSATAGASASYRRMSADSAAAHERSCRYRGLLDGLPGVAYTYMVGGEGVPAPTPYASPYVKDMTGYAPGAFLGERGFEDVVFGPDKPLAARLHESGGEAQYRVVRADGVLRWVSDSCRVSGRSPRTVSGFLSESGDAGMPASRTPGGDIVSLLERVPVVTYLDRLDQPSGRRTRVFTSPQVFNMLGHTPDEIAQDGTLWRSMIDPRDVAEMDSRGYPVDHAPGETLRSEYRMHTNDGRTVWVRDEVVVSVDETGGPTYLHGAIHDITREHEVEAQTRFAAQHDSLTGLLNRALLRGTLANAIEEADRSGRGFSLLFMDLDEFKDINDTLGHEFGDRVLIAVGRRLQNSLREGDVVARLGGDEFAAVLHGAGSESAAAVARDLAETVEAPLLLDGIPVTVGCSIGVASYPEHQAATDGDMMRIADVAMYAAKRSRSRVAVFEKGLEDAIDRNGFAHLGELHAALERKEFTLFYQPWLNGRDGGVSACEALIRWNHPTRGLVAPGEFLPLAERAGLIRALDLCVLDIACAQAAAWRAAGLGIRIGVNASRASLLDDDFSAAVAGALHHYQLDGSEIEIEITENGVLGDPEQAAFFAERLSTLGVRLAIDDFGTGYSSLVQFRKMRVSTLKIDQSFVRGMLSDDDDATIVKSVLNLGHDFGQEVVAEGVEDEATMDMLRKLGVDYIQGYVVARPMPVGAFEAWLAAKRGPDAAPQGAGSPEAMPEAEG